MDRIRFPGFVSPQSDLVMCMWVRFFREYFTYPLQHLKVNTSKNTYTHHAPRRCLCGCAAARRRSCRALSGFNPGGNGKVVYSLNSEKYGIHNSIDREMKKNPEYGRVFSPDLCNEWRARCASPRRAQRKQFCEPKNCVHVI